MAALKERLVSPEHTLERQPDESLEQVPIHRNAAPESLDLERFLGRTCSGSAESALGDLRFRALLSDTAWADLPPAVRTRFSKRLAGGRTIIYTGKIVATDFSKVGMALANLARLIGAPLPTTRDTDVPSVVSVTEDMAGGGQIWTRLYARRASFPQIIHSAKRFSGETGLEEHVGGGIGMSLTVSVENGALLFKSHRYFWQVGRLRINLPRWATPGHLTVGHQDLGHGRFAFTLDIQHPWFGRIIHQRGEFEEATV